MPSWSKISVAVLAQAANPPSFDKQFVRDWLEAVRINGKPWDMTPPSPHLPPDVISKTAAKYQEALERLTARLPDGLPCSNRVTPGIHQLKEQWRDQ